MNLILKVILLLLCFKINHIDSKRILCIFTTPSVSHLIIHKSVANALAERGHDVTVVTVQPVSKLNENIEHILIKLPEYEIKFKELIKNMSNKSSFALTIQMIAISKYFNEFAAAVVQHEKMQEILREREYDLVALGYVFNELHLGIAAHFKCPVVFVWVNQPMPFTNALIGNPDELSFAQLIFAQGDQPMRFINRLKGIASVLVPKLITNIYVNHLVVEKYNEIFDSKKGYPPYSEVIKNVSIVLTASHFSDMIIRPAVPGLIEIGGIQVKTKPDPLPKDLEKFLDSAKDDGAILFSLGSAAKSSELNETIIQQIYNVLSNLPQKVMWKWETDKLPGKASNIYFSKWLPQDDILAHPNTRLFISHGGLGSITESRYHGVPILGIPIFGDQFTNLESIKVAGWSEIIDLNSFDAKNFENTLKSVLYESKYKNTIQRISSIYRDRPLSAKDTAIYWIEYVMRHHGAKHLQSPLVHMSFIEYYLIDVIGFVLIVAFVLYKLTKYFIKFVIRKLFKGKKEKIKTK